MEERLAPLEPQEAWSILKADLRTMAGRSTFDLWFSQLEPLRMSNDVLYLTGPNHVIAWVDRRYEDLLARSLRQLGGRVSEIRLVQRESQVPSAAQGAGFSDSAIPRQRDRQTFERFVIGPGNRIAHGAALAVAEAPGEAYNPLFLHGNPGLGKSHLLGAIADYIDRNNPELKIHSTTAESFTAEFIQAVQTRGIEEFKNRYRRVDVLLIDDVQFLEGKARTADEFFHTLNALHLVGSQIVLSADRMPSELSTLADRLRERFEWGLVVDIDQPDLATRRAFLETFAAAEEIELSPETTEVLADYSLASIRAVEGALTRVMARASLGGGELTPELVETVLGTAELEREFEDRSVVTIDQIKSLVSERFSVSLEDLDSSKRSERVSSARQVAMTLAREFTAMSLPAIASAFCRKDHSTVIHGINRIDSRVQTDHEFADLVEKCRSELRAR
ncbi:MAG: chromosomal replication initiator protein DnaA [bacterium]